MKKITTKVLESKNYREFYILMADNIEKGWEYVSSYIYDETGSCIALFKKVIEEKELEL